MPQRLVQHNRRRGRDVERVGRPPHRYCNLNVGRLQPLAAEAAVLAAEHDRACKGEIHVGVELFSARRGGDDPHAVPLEPCERLGGRGHRRRQGEDRAEAGADHVRVGEFRGRVADDQAACPGAVGRSEEGAQVAGLLDPVDDEVQGAFGAGEQVERVLAPPGDGDDAAGALAVGHFGEYAARDGRESGAGAAQLAEQGRFVLAGGELRTDEDLVDLDAAQQRSRDLPRAFDRHQPRALPLAALAEAQDGLDARVGGAGDPLGVFWHAVTPVAPGCGDEKGSGRGSGSGLFGRATSKRYPAARDGRNVYFGGKPDEAITVERKKACAERGHPVLVTMPPKGVD